ncbi:phage tail protein [Sphingomonas oligophenolica]|uniref:Phage tail protein n=1 Tax=Sphingomonas oligophenolica TaxID=301154 RepID=A0A502CN95_9SPHN|nr:phage tail protein [Sphingomonas oligophenolica]TPG14358.1 phage tail protein [Sphingomonas oligophenolica]
MIKPDGLARLLLASVPALATDPTRLQLFVDKGNIAARRGATLGYEERYTLSIVVQEFAGDVDTLFVPILAWVAEQQPDLLDRGQPFTFSAEVLDDDRCDIEIAIELSELVLVAAKPGGGFTTTRVDQRQVGIDEFPGVCGASLWQLFLRDELVAQTTDPDALAILAA